MRYIMIQESNAANVFSLSCPSSIAGRYQQKFSLLITGQAVTALYISDNFGHMQTFAPSGQSKEQHE